MTPADTPAALAALNDDDWSRFDAILRATMSHVDFWHHSVLVDCVRHALPALLAAARQGAEDTTGEESYWCGCIRRASWTRCEQHGELEHDEEPPSRPRPRRTRAARAASQREEVSRG